MMTFVSHVLAVCMLALVLCAPHAVAQSVETKDQHDARMAWWRDARFGLFLHWGLYSIPAGEWNGQTNHAEWIRTTAHVPIPEYEKLLPQFNPVKFDANAFVRMAKDAGMKYIVITSKHHDGFCLFDSQYTDFDVMATPFKRDIMKELSEACHREGLKMCWYHSIMDWHHPDYLPRRDWEAKDRPANGADFSRYVQYLHNEVTELLTRYGDIGVMWFDGEWEATWTHEEGKALYDLCRKLQPNVIVNNRVDTGRSGMAGMTAEGNFVGDFGTPEQEIPATGMPGVDWETCMTMNDHWGYNKNDHHWKSSQELIQKLVDIASKGGNFLLNIGPTAQGEFPPEAVERLHALGAWMKVNGDAIYGTSASPFAALDWGRCTLKRAATDKSSILYLHVFDWPKNGDLVVAGLGNEQCTARLLTNPSTTLAVSRAGSDIHIALPPSAPDPACSVIALQVDGEPIVYRPPTITAAADILIKSMPITIAAPPSAQPLEVRYTLDGREPTMQSSRAEPNQPVTINDSCTVKARTFHNDKPASSVAERQFTHVEPKNPQPHKISMRPGLLCSVYHGDWSTLPDFDALKPASTERVDNVALPPGRPEEHVARMFVGWITVPADDVYVFALSSDDGSRLMVGGRVVVENNGLHPSQERQGAVALATGAHAIIVQYFNKGGDAELALRMAAAGQPLKPVEPGMLVCIPPAGVK